MRMKRASTAAARTVNLYCAQCDSQIGIFENGWERLTASYVKAKAEGITFNTEVGTKLQIVPAGPSQKAAEGCLMAELTCKQCSSMVGQRCQGASHPDKEYLVNQQFYKLSRVYLKDARKLEQVDPVFDENEQSLAKPNSANGRSMASTTRYEMAHTTTESHAFQSPLESHSLSTPPSTFQYPASCTPTSSQLSHGAIQHHFPPPARSQTPFQSSNTGPTSARPGAGTMLHEGLNESREALARLSVRLDKLEGHFATSTGQLTNFEGTFASTDEAAQHRGGEVLVSRNHHEQLETKISPSKLTYCQHCGEQQQQQQQQAKRDEQQEQITALTDQLESIKQTIVELKAFVDSASPRPLVSSFPGPNSGDVLENLEVMVRAMRSARSKDDELRVLREENKAMKARLSSIATAVVTNDNETKDAEPHHDDSSSTILGKRKRRPSESAKNSQTSARPGRVVCCPPLPNPDCTLEDMGPSAFEEVDNSGRGGRARWSTMTESSRPSFEHGSEQAGEAVIEKVSAGTISDATGALVIEAPLLAFNSVADSLTVPVSASGAVAMLAIDGTGAIRDPPSGRGRTIGYAPLYHSLHTFPQSFNPSELYIEGRKTTCKSHGPSAFLFSGPEAVSALFTSHVLAIRHALGPQHLAHCSSGFGPQQRLTAGNDASSSAIMKGQRLEETIHQSTKKPRVSEPKPLSSQPGDSRQGVARGSPLPRPHAACWAATTLDTPPKPQVQHSTSNQTLSSEVDQILPNAAAIDFSDDEMDEPAADSKIASKSQPVVDHRMSVEAALGMSISRIVRGDNLKPVTRPVIEDKIYQLPTTRTTSGLETRNYPSSVVPQFGAMIQTVTGSTIRPAQPPSSTSAAHILNETVAKHRKSEPIFGLSTNRVKNPTSASIKARTGTVQKASRKALPLTETPDSANRQALPSSKKELDGQHATSVHIEAKENGVAPVDTVTIEDNDDNCAVCRRAGNLLCCDGCPRSYHRRCLKPPLSARTVLEGDWFCPQCTENRQAHGSGLKSQ